MIDYDLSRRPGRPSEWQALAAAIIASTEPEENYWLEEKSMLLWSTPKGLGTLARAILGLANRDPGRAAKYLEGRGVVIVTDVETLDNADLDNKLATYVGGNDGPRWEPHWVRVGDKPVLLVEVDAPAASDPPYTLRQKFDDYRATQIFVREIGKTVLATQADIERLARRMLASDVTETLDVAVTVDVSEPLSTYYWDDAALESFLGGERAKLLVPLQEAQAAAAEAAKPIVLGGLRGVSGADTITELFANLHNPDLFEGLAAEREVPEPRSADQYMAEVEAYIEAVRAAMPKALEAVASSVVIAPWFLLNNLSDRNFNDVEVTIRVEGEASATHLDDRETVNPEPVKLRSLLPRRPRPYGPYKEPTRFGLMGQFPFKDIGHLAGVSPMPWHDVQVGRRDIRNGGSFEADFDAIDLRPRKQEVVVESNLALVIPRHRTEPVIVHWHATASNVNAVASGEFAVPFDGEPFDVLALALQGE